jgi:hypothetical protein
MASWGVEMSAKNKSWWQSKTIWINAITAATATLTALGGQQIVAENPKAAAAIVAVLGGLNIALRIITVLPIGGE